MKPSINHKKIVFFTGAGVSAESGLDTFRGAGGTWDEVDVMAVASTTGWNQNPQQVLDFYNARRQVMLGASPNKAHLAIAALQAKYEVVVITQNIDDLHERAGSQSVLHLHGDITYGRSSINKNLLYPIGPEGLSLGTLCDEGSQIRPNIVWFGETVFGMDEAKEHIREAGTVVAIGSSLIVQPAAGLLKHARFGARKYLITLDIASKPPQGFKWIRAKATECENLLLNL